jgi:hypothetical protein
MYSTIPILRNIKSAPARIILHGSRVRLHCPAVVNLQGFSANLDRSRTNLHGSKIRLRDPKMNLSATMNHYGNRPRG